MTNPLVSCNLLLYRPRFYLRPCLESIFAQTYDNFEFLIIDNHSEDGTIDEVRRIIEGALEKGQKLPPYRIVANERNLGFAAGHNLGIRECRGELIVLVNQDVILDKDFVKEVVGVFAQNEKIGSAQGKLLRLKAEENNLTKTSMLDNSGLVILKNRRIIARGQGQKDEGQFAKTEEIFGVDGALPVYRRLALEDVKSRVNPSNRFASDPRSGSAFDPRYEYFDEDFFAYKEDVDLAWRLRLSGWQAFYTPSAVAWHARTAGDSAATSYADIIRERLKISKFAKELSFKNQRLMQIKNEQPSLLVRHLIWWLPKEIASWIYVILFERYTWRAMRDLFRQAPRAWQKRKIIMAKKRVEAREMERWFEKNF